MKRITTTLLATPLLALFALTAIPANAQDLFSREKLSNQDVQASSNSSNLSDRELRQVLERAGFEIVTTHSGNVYEIEKTEGDWTFPVLVELSPDGSNLWVTVVLQEFTGRLEDHAVRFAKLLAVNGTYGNVFFKFDTETKMMMLVGSRPNQNITPSVADELIGLLSAIAVENDRLWKMNDEELETSFEDQIIGSWLHSEEGRSMELSFRANSRFTTILIDDGQKNSFSGTYTISADYIELTSDDGEEFSLPLVSLTRNNLTIDLDGSEFVLVRR